MTQQKPLVKKNILDFSGFVYADPVKEREKDRAKLLGYHLPVIHSLLDLFDLARGSGDAGTKVRVNRPPTRPGTRVCVCDERAIARRRAGMVERRGLTPSPPFASGGTHTYTYIHTRACRADTALPPWTVRPKDAKVDRILDFLDRPVLDGSKKNLAEAAEKKKAKAARKKKAGAKKRKRAAGAAAGRSHGGDEGEEDDDDEDDDVPLIAKLPPKLPSDAKIEAAVTDIVRGSDLNELTMKGVREQLAISFKCDVTSKKKLISTYVSAALEAMRNEGGEE